MEEWLSVKDAAEMAGVTQQAIYKRLDTTLKDFVKQVGKRKYIHVKGLEHIQPTKNNQPDNNIQPTSINVELMETLNKTIDLLQKQLEVKDKQIDVKDKQLETKDNQIQAINNRLEQALKNSSETHFLMAQKQVMLDEPEEKKVSWFKRIFRNVEK